ncbi:hypothetical protein [Deinococcus aquiradiocola]|uniref:Uncharacterized protein n=1 Tax=Deinococcus aquiradiocola TaxID=393059 RepID=A0A917UJ41_9DEIO|nr:hypothetical protein [Deinococcus aquiradiocola]GGJ61154.1 hypothetical protein GCM10008939_01110 [Deinococcus aquiradiocola]
MYRRDRAARYRDGVALYCVEFWQPYPLQYLGNLGFHDTVTDALNACQQHSGTPLRWRMPVQGHFVAANEYAEYRIVRLGAEEERLLPRRNPQGSAGT